LRWTLANYLFNPTVIITFALIMIPRDL